MLSQSTNALPMFPTYNYNNTYAQTQEPQNKKKGNKALGVANSTLAGAAIGAGAICAHDTISVSKLRAAAEAARKNPALHDLSEEGKGAREAAAKVLSGLNKKLDKFNNSSFLEEIKTKLTSTKKLTEKFTKLYTENANKYGYSEELLKEQLEALPDKIEYMKIMASNNLKAKSGKIALGAAVGAAVLTGAYLLVKNLKNKDDKVQNS